VTGLLSGLVLAEAAPAAPAEGDSPGGGFGPMLPIVLIFVIFYFLMLRPQSKERKKREALVKGVKKYDKIVTTAGIHGEVVEVSETTVRVRVDDSTRLTFDRSAIWQVKPKEGEIAANEQGKASSKDGAKDTSSKDAGSKETGSAKGQSSKEQSPKEQRQEKGKA